MPNRVDLLGAYDAQLRVIVPDTLPAGWAVERDGPLTRFQGIGDRAWVLYRDLEGRQGAAIDELIERQVRHFSEIGRRFEWKYHGHDLPVDLPDRLMAHGLVPEELETIEIGRVADIAAQPRPPEGVTLREVTALADLERIAEMESKVWAEDNSDYAQQLEAEIAADPTALTVVVAEAGDTVVSAAWMRFERGTEFATMWGGATLAEWRGLGIYRALVAHRATLAAARGFQYLETDASSDSRPILERLGFVPVTTSTPYVWAPPA